MTLVKGISQHHTLYLNYCKVHIVVKVMVSVYLNSFNEKGINNSSVSSKKRNNSNSTTN